MSQSGHRFNGAQFQKVTKIFKVHIKIFFEAVQCLWSTQIRSREWPTYGETLGRIMNSCEENTFLHIKRGNVILPGDIKVDISISWTYEKFYYGFQMDSYDSCFRQANVIALFKQKLCRLSYSTLDIVQTIYIYESLAQQIVISSTLLSL